MRQIKTADEQDAFTGWRHVTRWRPGERKAIKRRANKRERLEARLELRDVAQWKSAKNF